MVFQRAQFLGYEEKNGPSGPRFVEKLSQVRLSGEKSWRISSGDDRPPKNSPETLCAFSGLYLWNFSMFHVKTAFKKGGLLFHDNYETRVRECFRVRRGVFCGAF